MNYYEVGSLITLGWGFVIVNTAPVELSLPKTIGSLLPALFALHPSSCFARH